MNSVVQSDITYAGSAYAFQFRALQWWTGMKKDVSYNLNSALKGFREPDCITYGTTLYIEMKVRQAQETQPGVFEGLDCNEGDNVNGLACPFVRISIRTDGSWKGANLGYQTSYTSGWQKDDWNHFSVTWTVPESWNTGYPIERFLFQFCPGRVSESDPYYMFVDDFRYNVIPSSESPSVTPSESSVPSFAPSTSFPSQNPSSFPDYNSETIFKVLDEKQDEIYLKNAVSNLQVRVNNMDCSSNL